ncbi:MAG: family 1 glycosylhydrolase, partial [Planctomycetota bacterium]
HHALLAHGRSVCAIRAAAKTPPRVGWAPVGTVCYPKHETPACIDAAYRATMSVSSKGMGMGTFNNTWFSDPALLGRYPEDGLRLFDEHLPACVRDADADLEVIHQPLDFYGVNIYRGQPVSVGPEGEPVVEQLPGDFPRTLIDWPVTPEALRWGPRFFHDRYGLPIYITENGLSNPDWISVDGQCHDPQRIDFMSRYLSEFARAGADGVELGGYFHWSVMDNFEWAEGYRHRFGLIHVDYATQRRTLKDSAHWYCDVIESNGASLGSAWAGTTPLEPNPA